MRFLLPPAAALLLASCALGPAAQLTVRLPPLPDAWSAVFPRVDCLLTWTDGSGQTEWERMDGWTSGHLIDCTKQANAAVLAYPMIASDSNPLQPGMLRPAGGVYPESVLADQDPSSLGLTWQDGAVARVAQELAGAGLDASRFNVGRLAQELRERPDPWDLDLDTMVQRIAAGDFTVYDIDPLVLRDIRVPCGDGRWVMESPFRGASVSDAGGELHLAAVSLGPHTVFSTTGRVVKVEVREREVISSPVRAAPLRHR